MRGLMLRLIESIPMPLEDDKTSCPLVTMPLQSSVVYGPLDSRRFGRSLGINLLPTDQKICSFDCVYCQYRDEIRHEDCHFLPSTDILKEVGERFAAHRNENKKIDWIMFSGNGEASMHPEFLKIVDGVIALREQWLPGVPIGILSNSATCYLPEVQNALIKLNGRFMKLDAGSIRTFYAMNRPGSTMMWGDIICGLYHLPRITLQSMFITGTVDNTGDDAVNDWIRAVEYIRPMSVQVYTVERPTQVSGIHPVSHEKLEEIARRLTLTTQIHATVY